jgi:hypothetical protein
MTGFGSRSREVEVDEGQTDLSARRTLLLTNTQTPALSAGGMYTTATLSAAQFVIDSAESLSPSNHDPFRRPVPAGSRVVSLLV